MTAREYEKEGGISRFSLDRRITVLGAGSWGTAVASTLAGDGADVTLWARREEQAAEKSEAEWTSIIRQLIHRGFLEQDIANYSVLTLTATARPLLRGEEGLVQTAGAAVPIRHIMPDEGFVNFADPIPLHVSGFGPRSLGLNRSCSRDRRTRRTHNSTGDGSSREPPGRRPRTRPCGPSR